MSRRELAEQEPTHIIAEESDGDDILDGYFDEEEDQAKTESAPEPEHIPEPETLLRLSTYLSQSRHQKLPI